jgi:hypothetical protein
VYHGRAIDAQGDPIGGAEVRLCRGHSGGFPLCEETVAQTQTEDDGTFVLEPGEASEGDPGDLASETEAGEPDALAVEKSDYGAALAMGPALVLAKTQGLTVTLRSPGRVVGRVLLRDGTPAPRWTVAWSLVGGKTGGDHYMAGEDSYELEGLPEGEIVVYARGVDQEDNKLVGASRVRLAAGVTERLDVVLEARVLVVSGILRDQAGEPIAGARVSAVPDRPSDLDGFLARTRDEVTTSAAGSFSVEFASPGPHLLRFVLAENEQVVAEARLPAAEQRGEDPLLHVVESNHSARGDSGPGTTVVRR